MGAFRQEFGELIVHTPHGRTRLELPWTFSTFDYRELCALLQAQSDCEFETAKVNGRTGDVVHTDRGDLRAPLIVDGLGWRRVLGNGYQPPDAPLSRGLEVHPHGSGDDLEIWIDRKYVPAGYGWSFPARDEVRIGVGSFDPRFHVKDTTVELATDLDREAVRYQGNWIPHKLRDATEDGIFFVGDSAGHCLPLTAEGIRTALYFGIACGRELRAVVEGRATVAEALTRYHDFSAAHEWKFRWMLRAQRIVPRVPPRAAPARRSGDEQRRSSAGRSSTTCRSRRRASSRPGPPPRAVGRAAPHARAVGAPSAAHFAASQFSPTPTSTPERRVELERVRHLARDDLAAASTSSAGASNSSSSWIWSTSACREAGVAQLVAAAHHRDLDDVRGGALDDHVDREPLAELARHAVAGAQLGDAPDAPEQRASRGPRSSRSRSSPR